MGPGGEHSSPGDPDGRRLARRRAAKLSEASRVLEAARAILNAIEVAIPGLDSVCNDLAQREQQELQRALGRIERRRRFKYRSGHPLYEGRHSSVLFLDECGVSHQQPERAGAVFVLAGVCMHAEDVDAYRQRADEVKRKFFGTAAVTFHEPNMRHHDGLYYFENSQMRQSEFDAAVEQLIRTTPMVAFGAAIRKDAFADTFIAAGLDPYLPTSVYALAITLLMERFADYLAAVDPGRLGRVVFESQGPNEDALHQVDYARLLVDGTQWVPSSAFQQTIEPGAQFATKAGSSPLELADILSRDLWEWVSARCVGEPARWQAFCERIYGRGTGAMGTFGVKVFPDADIRELIEAHRRRVLTDRTGN